MKTQTKILTTCGLILFLFPSLIQATLFDKNEYASRRSKLMGMIPDGAAILMGAVPPADGGPFFQNNDLVYFSGIEIPDAVLVIDGEKKESTLFFSISEREADGEGLPLELIRDPRNFTGIENVLPMDRFAMFLSRLSLETSVFYTNYRPSELMFVNTNEKFRALQKTMTLNMWDGRLSRELQFVKQLKDKFPQVEIRDCGPLIWDLRKIKSPAEIKVMQKTAQIGVKAHIALIQSAEPGVSENELASVFAYVCQKEGAQGLAFPTILMSGKNHAYGHYHAHDRVLEDGDFVILDAGPDYGYYNADISTAFPANGTFTPRQKELYELAFLMRKTCQENYRPGITLKSIGQKVKEALVAEGRDPDDPQVRGEIRYGGYNHSVGLATHDAMGTFDGPDQVLKPGFVFACDIQVILPEEEIGIRLEDTIAITEEGYINLSAGLPRTIAEIEALMQQEGIIQILKKQGLY